MRKIVMISTSVFVLAACAATETPTTTDVVLTPAGTTAPQRNLLLADLSVGSPGNGRAIDEEFDIAVTAFRAAPDPDADPDQLGTPGLIRGETDTAFFGEGQTLTYLSGGNQFVFDIELMSGNFQRTVTNVLVQDPVDTPGIENSAIAKVWLSNPLWYFEANFGAPVNTQDVYPLDGVGPSSSVSDVAAELTRLQESEAEADNNRYNAIADAANSYINAGDQFFYGFQFADGNGYVEATNMNSADDEERITDTVAIISFREFLNTNEEYVGHAVYGHRTPSGEMPTTGTATYRGKVVGDVITNNSIQSLTGGINAEVRFAEGLMDMSIETTIREGSNNAAQTTFIPYKELSGLGVISDTTFDGTLTEDNGNATGTFQGAFFGPIAGEMGGTFQFGDDASYAAGAFTGRALEEE